MAEGKGGWFTGAQHVRNILISVLTTVLGTGAVWYLGFRGGGSSGAPDFLVVKDATINAWKEYVTLENIYFKNVQVGNQPAITTVSAVNDFQDGIFDEEHKFTADVDKMAENKNIDEAFLALLKRRSNVEKESEKKMLSFFNNWRTILRQTDPGPQRQDRLRTEYSELIRYGQPVVQHTKTEIVDLAKTLSDKYGQFFSTNDLLFFKEDNNANTNNNNTNNNNQNNNNNNNLNTNNNNTNNNNQNNNNQNNNNNQTTNSISVADMTGTWESEGGTLFLNQDGTTEWKWKGGQNSTGTWTVKTGNQLYQSITQGFNTGHYMAFNITDFTHNSFTMQLAYSPFNVFHATRK